MNYYPNTFLIKRGPRRPLLFKNIKDEKRKKKPVKLKVMPIKSTALEYFTHILSPRPSVKKGFFTNKMLTKLRKKIVAKQTAKILNARYFKTLHNHLIYSKITCFNHRFHY